MSSWEYVENTKLYKQAVGLNVQHKLVRKSS